MVVLLTGIVALHCCAALKVPEVTEGLGRFQPGSLREDSVFLHRNVSSVYIAKALFCLPAFINRRKHELPQWLPGYCSRAEYSLHWPELSLHLERTSQHATYLGARQLRQLHSEYCHCEALPWHASSKPSQCIPAFPLPVVHMFFMNPLSGLLYVFGAGISSMALSRLFVKVVTPPCL